jgi:hypothetical protein
MMSRPQKQAASLRNQSISCVSSAPRPTPTLPGSLFDLAIETLSHEGDRVVLGAAADGGYYLIGLRNVHSRLFDRNPVSTSLQLKVDHGRACSSRCDVACALPRWSSSRRHEGYTLVPQTCRLPGDTLLCRLLGDLASTTSQIHLPDRNSLRRTISSKHSVFAALPLGRHGLQTVRMGRET